MRKMFSAVAVIALAIGFSACSQDVSGPTSDPRFANQSGDAGNTQLKLRCGKNFVYNATTQKCVRA